MKHLIGLVLLILSTLNSAKAAEFIVISDMPYNDIERAMLAAPFGPIYNGIKAQDYDFIFHLGDIKSGGEKCTDSRLIAARDQIAALDTTKLVYTLGDNEWTDCDRQGHHELERLHFVKNLFFGEQSPIKPSLKSYTQQKTAPENASWQIDNIGFGSIHIPGTNFGRSQIKKDKLSEVLDYADIREQQSIEWLTHLFETHQERDALVLGFHADMFQKKYSKLKACDKDNRNKCNGYARIKQQLKILVEAYKKPVLLMHGDTEPLCLEQIENTANANLWRLNAAGDTRSDVIKLTVDTNSKTPFSAQRLLLPEKALHNCPQLAEL